MAEHRGILLYSGGLDSLLAGRLLMDQGIHLTGIHFLLPFTQPHIDHGELDAIKYAKQINLNVEVRRLGMEYLRMVENPPHGYGKEMNPCIDCKIFFFHNAAEFMRETGADFLVTGEVVGQRPMSQMKHTLNHIIREAGLEGRLLRPLSARLLKPTIPETRGMVDREMLLDINGRGRKRQFELARRYGIMEYSSPAGGCLFTDPNISVRIRDLFLYHPGYNEEDIYLLTIGRHFRISERCKLIIGRHEEENHILRLYRHRASLLLEPEFPGPTGFVQGEADTNDTDTMISILARYAKKGTEEFQVRIVNSRSRVVNADHSLAPDFLEQLRI